MKTAACLLAILVPAVSLAACGEKDEPTSDSSAQASTTAAATTPTEQAPERKGVSIKVQASDYGRMLFNASGQAIYLFTKETGSKSRCYGECAKAWPPVLTRGEPRARNGVQQSKLDTTKRRDGKLQATYNGHPLYYYVDDPKNKVLCQDVFEFGGTWYVVAPSGKAIT